LTTPSALWQSICAAVRATPVVGDRKSTAPSRHWATLVPAVSGVLVVPQRMDTGPGGGAARAVAVAVTGRGSHVLDCWHAY
jgi:hypothetical protein